MLSTQCSFRAKVEARVGFTYQNLPMPVGTMVAKVRGRAPVSTHMVETTAELDKKN